MQPMNKGQWGWAHWGVLLSAILSALAYPPAGLGLVILFAPSYWFAVLSTRNYRSGFGWGWTWGVVFGLVVGVPLLYLIEQRTGSTLIAVVGWVLVVAIQSLYWGIFGALASLAPLHPIRAALWLASAWTLVQWARGLGDFGFVWAHWSVALASRDSDIVSHTLLQAADLGGGWGLEWLIAFLNGLLASVFLTVHSQPYPNRKQRLTWLSVTLLLWGGYGVWQLQRYDSADDQSDSRVVLIVQPNLNLTEAVPPWEWEPVRDKVLKFTEAVISERIDLIVMSESIEPSALPGSRAVMERWSQTSKDLDCMILIGAPSQNLLGDKQMANGAFLFLPDGDHLSHEKVKLVPLGEHVPFRQWLPFLSLFGVVDEDLRPGQSLNPLIGRLGERIGVVICMESTFPWISRHLTANGANLLAVISNESWFGKTAALEQHAAFTSLRAVETRRWIARASPQGISGFYSPTGSAIVMPKFIEHTASHRVYLNEQKTLYVRFGEWILFLSIGLLLIQSIEARAPRSRARE